VSELPAGDPARLGGNVWNVQATTPVERSRLVWDHARCRRWTYRPARSGV